jgi:ribosome biogenesis protein MAK21
LLDIYFALFVSLLKPSKNQKFKGDKKHGKGKNQKGKNQKQNDNSEVQTEEMQDKLVSAVLTGVNRAYPFTSSNTERYDYHLNG